MRWAGPLAPTGERRGFVGKPEFKRQLGKPIYRWNIILKWIFKNLRAGFGLD
jgi:hypothetical protein